MNSETLIEEAQVLEELQELISSIWRRQMEMIHQHRDNCVKYVELTVAMINESLRTVGLDTKNPETNMSLVDELEEIDTLGKHAVELLFRHNELAAQHNAKKEALKAKVSRASSFQPWVSPPPLIRLLVAAILATSTVFGDRPLSSPTAQQLVIDETPVYPAPSQIVRRRLVFKSPNSEQSAKRQRLMIKHSPCSPSTAAAVPTTEQEEATTTATAAAAGDTAATTTETAATTTETAATTTETTARTTERATTTTGHAEATLTTSTTETASTTTEQAEATSVVAATTTTAKANKKVTKKRGFRRSKREYFDVFAVVDERYEKGIRSYKLRWNKRSQEYDSWVIESNCRCDNLTKKWHQKRD